MSARVVVDTRRPRTLTRLLVAILCTWLAFPMTPAMAQGIIRNGTSSGITTPGFLFEPEVPLASLKTVPTWFELEQLLDNPYTVALCSSLPAAGNQALNLMRNTPGNDQGWPSYCTTSAFTRRPSFGVPLPPLLVNPLNHNPTTGEEMRLLNSQYPGGRFSVPDTLELVDPNAAGGAGRYVWSYKRVEVSPGADRIDPGQAAIDYNAPIAPDAQSVRQLQRICITTTEASPAEGAILCGGDPGEPNYPGFGRNNANAYSTAAVPLPNAPRNPGRNITGLRLFDPDRGFIAPRDPASGAGGLRKPSLRVPPVGSPTAPGYLVNTDPDNVTPSNENDFVRNRTIAAALGKALFWDMQVGSDGVQSCGTCHFTGAGTDTRTKNQLNPNHLGNDLTIQLHGPTANQEVTLDDFPFHKLKDPEIAGDPACVSAITASVEPGILENNFPGGGSITVCSAANIDRDINDVMSSMGVMFSPFTDIAPIGEFLAPTSGVAAVKPDLRTVGASDPIPVFQGLRRVEPRNTPTMQAAGFNFDNFWDGRARHDFNGGSVFGAADPQSHVFVDDNGTLVPTRQLIRFSSIASLATGPALSEFEMSFAGRNWAKIGKKLLQVGVTPLANQLVSPTDSLLGPYSNQPGNPAPSPLCAPAALAARAINKPGLCASYNTLIQNAFYPALHRNAAMHLDGSPVSATPISILDAGGGVTTTTTDPFDGFSLSVAPGSALATNTNQFSQMEANFSLFWGLSVHMWVQLLVPDDTPFDRFLDLNPDAFATLGEPGEPGLVEGMLNCTTATQRFCFREVGNFKRDPGVRALRNATGEGGAGGVLVPAGGTRAANTPDPLLGLDIFFASNLSLKNTNFRTARCGECHAVPTLTDHTLPFTFKAQLRDFVGEFSSPGVEFVTEPLGRLRVISGFLLESEMNENGQDGVERRIANQSIAVCPTDGLAYPGGLEPGSGQGFGVCGGAAAGYFDNGVYNLGVRPIANDIGRGGNDAFGWPLSLAALMLKNLAGPGYNPGGDNPANGFAQPAPPGIPLPNFDAADPSGTGGLFEQSAQDQQINPGSEGEPLNPMLPPYLAPFANQINVGDSAPELDEVFSGLNTLTDIAMLEGFLDTLGPFNPAGVNNESLNMGESPLMGSWPNVNRVGRMGSFKAPQLRNVELTGPYFHNGGMATLRQVIDFYVRGGDFPITNAAHRDFNLLNMNIEVQSNLTEAEKVALVDFLLELTDDRVKFQRAPFDHPEVIIPLDGTAPDNISGRDGLLALTTGVCPGGTGPCFRDVPAVGAAGDAVPQATFLNVTKQRLVGQAAFDVKNSHYSH
jgi:cytochrome c peroxidase